MVWCMNNTDQGSATITFWAKDDEGRVVEIDSHISDVQDVHALLRFLGRHGILHRAKSECITDETGQLPLGELKYGEDGMVIR